MVEKGADDVLQLCEGFGVQWWRGVFVGCVLDGGAVVGRVPGVWCMLGACGLVVEKFLEGTGDIREPEPVLRKEFFKNK